VVAAFTMVVFVPKMEFEEIRNMQTTIERITRANSLLNLLIRILQLFSLGVVDNVFGVIKPYPEKVETFGCEIGIYVQVE